MKDTDHKSIPDASGAQQLTQDDHKPPESEIEREIAEVWKEVLEVEAVGVDDNFFDLGGHSLAMVKVYERMKERLGGRVERAGVTLIEMFEQASIRRMAARLGQGEIVGGKLEEVRKRGEKARRAMQWQKQQTQERKGRNG